MGYQAERDRTLIQLGRAGFTAFHARQLLALGTTLQRLAEAQCNGDYPWDNGERKITPCPRCEAGVHPTALRGKRIRCACSHTNVTSAGCPTCQGTGYRSDTRYCPDCRAQDRVRKVLADGPTERMAGLTSRPAWVPKFGGDPRGCVFWIYPAGTPEADIENGRARGEGIAIVGRY